MSTAAAIPDQYEFVDRVPVFDEHEEFVRGSDKPVREFPAKKLDAACKHYNGRAERRGHFGVLGPGHTLLRGPDGLPVPEMRQPPAWGIHANHRVEKLPDGTPAIFVDRYAKRGMVPDGMGGKVNAREAIMQMPYMSVEYWTTDADGKEIPGYIGRLALLNQDPKRECGTFMYSKADIVPATKTRTLFADESQTKRLALEERGACLFYSMESTAMPFDTDPLNDPAADASAEKPSQSLINGIVEALKAMFPQVFSTPAPALDAPLGDAPLPGGGDAPGGDMPLPKEEPAMFSKGSQDRSAKNYEVAKDRKIAALEAKIAALEKKDVERAEHFSKTDAEARVDRLQRDGIKCDRDREVLKFLKMPIEERDAEEQYMAETDAKSDQYRDLPPAQFIDTRGPQRGPKDKVDHDKVREYIRQNGCSVDEAVSHFAKLGA